jgi:hypothetical protein
MSLNVFEKYSENSDLNSQEINSNPLINKKEFLDPNQIKLQREVI